MNDHLLGKRGEIVSACAVLLAGFALAASVAVAQDNTTTGDEEPVVLEKYVTTGSFIPYAAEAPAIPVQVVSGSKIESSGESGDLLEVIRKTVPQFIGNGNLGSSSSNIGSGSTNGGSQVRLRNVQTLVLIDGRRAAFAPVAATGGFNFVDVNSIPVSAVERIEVLSDGASAIYGSDAVSGVVNIILKQNYEGVEVGGGYRVATEKGHWEERSARVIAGARAGKTDITISAEWVKSDPLYQDERAFSADQTGKTSSYPGIAQAFPGGVFLLKSGVNAPPLDADLTPEELVAQGYYEGPITDAAARFNVAPYVTLQLGNEKKSVTAAINHKISPNLEAFGDILYSKTKTFSQLAAQPIVGMPFAAEHVSDLGIGVGITDPDHPQNPFDTIVLVRNRFIDHPRLYENLNNTLRVMGGLRGKINERFSWEGAVNFNDVDQTFRNANVINRTALAQAIDAGTINLFARTQDPTALAQAGIFGTAYSINSSTLNTADLRLNGQIPDLLPGGDLQFAVGIEARRETLSGQPDAGSYLITDPTTPLYGFPSNWDGATTADPFDAKRNVDAAFAQVRVPLVSPEQHISGLYTLDLDVALRYERYSDTDDPLVPKVLLRYLPFNNELAFRASYSQSFSAPDLYTLFGPAGVGFTEQVVELDRYDGGKILDADQGFLRQPSNANLKPEKAKNYNLGVVYSPKGLKGLTVEAGYFRIEQRDVVGVTSDLDIMQDVELNGTASPYADRVHIGGFNGAPVTGPGQLSAAFDQYGQSFAAVYVTTFPENIVRAMQDGADLQVNYTFNTAGGDRWDFALNGIWYNRFLVDDEEYVGTTNGRSVLNGGTIPDWRATFSGAWQRDGLRLGFTTEYIPSVEDTGSNPPTKVQYFARLDVFGRYQFASSGWLKGLTVRAGVNNVFNRMPPPSPASWTDANADTGTYGALGRVLYVDASYKF